MSDQKLLLLLLLLFGIGGERGMGFVYVSALAVCIPALFLSWPFL